jgi:hypothetical protein
MTGVNTIARTAHEVNRAYCAALGDLTQPAWEDAPSWQRDSAVKGVQFALANPDATPEQQHESWMQTKAEEGWAWGEKKDPERKLHPCMLPYESLPIEQRVKDHLFRAVVRSLA